MTRHDGFVRQDDGPNADAHCRPAHEERHSVVSSERRKLHLPREVLHDRHYWQWHGE